MYRNDRWFNYRYSPARTRRNESDNTIKTIKSLLENRRRTEAKTVSTPKKQEFLSFDVNLIINDLFSSFKSTFNKSEVLLCIIFSGCLVYSMYSNFSNNPLGVWALQNCKTNNFAGWVVKNYMQFFGMLIFLPSCFDLKKEIRFFAIILTTLWCFMVPEASILEYFVQSIALHSFFKVQLHQSKVFILCFVGCTYYFGFLFSKSVSQTLLPKNHTCV